MRKSLGNHHQVTGTHTDIRPALRALHPKPSPSHQRQLEFRKCGTTAVLPDIHPLVQVISHRFDLPLTFNMVDLKDLSLYP